MKHKLIRLLLISLTILLLISVMAGAVSARDILDSSCRGSITVTLSSKAEEPHKIHPVKAAELSIYQVANAMLDDNGNEFFAYTEAFQSASMDINNLKADGLICYLVDYISRNQAAALDAKLTSDSGVVKFSNLPVGLYLIQMTKQDKEFHSMKAFLVSLPMQAEDGTKIYDVTATPKLQVTRDTIDLKVTKIWKNDHQSERPQSITVELLGNSQLTDTAILNEEYNWTYTFKNLPKAINWQVQEEKVPDGYDSTVGDLVIVNNVYTVTITNTKKAPPPPLIQTGQLNWPVPLLTIGGVVLIITEWVFCHEKSKRCKKSYVGTVMGTLGSLLLIGALLLYTLNQQDSIKAGKISAEILPEVQGAILQNAQVQEKTAGTELHINPYDQEAVTQSQEMTTALINGYRYIGVLSIPDLELHLPVMSDWSYKQLQIAPCRHMGSTKSDNLVIAAHNYDTHFGRLKELQQGDLIEFVDMDGMVNRYAVCTINIIPPTAIEEITAEELDLVLYTCAYGGKNRVMVGCQRIQDTLPYQKHRQ